jgi:lysozyme
MYLWDAFSDYRIWTRNVVTETNLEHWDIWQYTDRMRLDGYDGKETFIDMNVLYQDEDFLNQQQ